MRREAPCRRRFRKSCLSLLPLAALLIVSGACAPKEPTEPPPPTTGFSTNPYCAEGVVLCSDLPGETIDVPPGCLSSDQQCSRDFWSWQNFVSLNWPGKIVDAPEGVQIVEPNPDASIGDAGDRVWELWMDPDDVFLPGAEQPSWKPGPTTSPYCPDPDVGKALAGRTAKSAVSFDLDADSFFEATIQQPLIDQSLNFAVFEIRMNMEEVGWVVENGLYVEATVDDWPKDKTLNLPAPAIEVKAAWRILAEDMPESQKARYYHRQAGIVLDPEHVEGASGSEPVCIVRDLGLVGLHIRHNGLWSTFEQVDNVTAHDGVQPTFFNPSCTDCTVNVPPTDQDGQPIPPADYKWTLTGPSASLYEGFPNVPAQITRAPGQDQWIDVEMNSWWQGTVLKDTVWQYYMQITTNWTEFENSQPIPTLNTSMEPYIPSNPNLPQDCIGCHNLATNQNGAEMAQTFLVFRACPETPSPGQKLPPNCTPVGVDTLASGD